MPLRRRTTAPTDTTGAGKHAAPTPARPHRGNALVAAAAVLRRGQVASATTGTGGPDRSWQAEAWDHYDTCGELRFACNWLGNALSKARLVAAVAGDADAAPTPLPDTHPASLALAELCGGADGRAEMLGRLGVHLSVPGESYLVVFDNPDTQQREWHTLCGDEISTVAGKTVITRMGQPYELPEPPDPVLDPTGAALADGDPVDADGSLIIRIWRPHPRRHWDADSPTRGLRIVLNELAKLTDHVAAQVDSRLAGAGLLLLPNELTFPSGPPQQGPAAPTDPAPVDTAYAQASLDQFVELLTEAMMRAIGDRDDASALVPVVLQGPGEHIANVRLIRFDSDLGQQAMGLRQEAIRRLALGLDMPPEVLLGMSDANHWTAWQISESGVGEHVEPLLGIICQALTTGWLRTVYPELDPATIIWFDTSEMTQRPDRSGVAGELYDRGALSAEALRREAGFGDDDAPDPAEQRLRALLRLIDQGAPDPQTISALLELVGYVRPGDLPDVPAEGQLEPAAPATTTPPAPADPPRALPAAPDAAPTPPDSGPPAAAAAHTAAAVADAYGRAVARCAALHAMHRAGGRLLRADRAYRAQHAGVPLPLLHTRVAVAQAQLPHLLAGAEDPFTALPEWPRVGPVVLQVCGQHLLAGTPLDLPALDQAVATAGQPATAQLAPA